MLIFGVLIALPLWSLILGAIAMVTQALGYMGASRILAQLALASGTLFLALGLVSWAASRLARRSVPA